MSSASPSDVIDEVAARTDSLTGPRTDVVDSRRNRPGLPSATRPFCPGGLDAPAAYDVRWFAAGELGSGVYFNPAAPEAAARALREAGR